MLKKVTKEVEVNICELCGEEISRAIRPTIIIDKGNINREFHPTCIDELVLGNLIEE